MNEKSKQINEQEFYEIVHIIAKPTFHFILKRITKEILNNKKYQQLDVNDFFNAIIASMASIDTNMIRWVQGFYKIKTNSQLDQNRLIMTLVRSLNEQLEIIVQ